MPMQVYTPVSFYHHSSNRREPAYGKFTCIRWRKLSAIDCWFNILQAGIPFCHGSTFDLVPSRGNSISKSFDCKRAFPYKPTTYLRWADRRTADSSFQIILTGVGCWSNVQEGICANPHQCHSATDAHPLMKQTSKIQSSDLKLSIPTLTFYKRALVVAVVNFFDGFPSSASKKLHQLHSHFRLWIKPYPTMEGLWNWWFPSLKFTRRCWLLQNSMGGFWAVFTIFSFRPQLLPAYKINLSGRWSSLNLSDIHLRNIPAGCGWACCWSIRGSDSVLLPQRPCFDFSFHPLVDQIIPNDKAASDTAIPAFRYHPRALVVAQSKERAQRYFYDNVFSTSAFTRFWIKPYQKMEQSELERFHFLDFTCGLW